MIGEKRGRERERERERYGKGERQDHEERGTSERRKGRRENAAGVCFRRDT